MKISSAIILLILLQFLFLNISSKGIPGGIIRERVARIQQPGLLDLEGNNVNENSEEATDTPESSANNNPSQSDADSITSNARTFDPATRLV